MDEKPKQLTLAQEAGLPENWVPLDAPPIVPGQPAVGNPNEFQGSLPPGYQHDVSFVGTERGKEQINRLALMPLGINGNPTSNAAVTSTVIKVAGEAGASTIGLNIPNIFTPVSQTVKLPGPLAFSLAPEAPHTALMGPITGGEADQTANYTNYTPSSFSLATTASANNELAVAVYFNSNTGATPNPSGGWTSLFNLSGGYLGTQVVSAGPVSFAPANFTTGGHPTAAILSTFYTSATPTIVQSQQDTSYDSFNSIPHTGLTYTVSFTNPVVAGNTVIVGFFWNANQGSAPITITDNFGNTYTTVLEAQTNGLTPYADAVSVLAYTPVKNSGLGTFTVTVTFGATANNGGNLVFGMWEVTNLTVPSAIPTFRLIQPSDVPPISLALVGINGGITGTLGVGNGGTGDTTLTAHNVLLGEGTSPVGFAAPGTAGQVLTSNGATSDPTFQAIPTDTDYYQTVQANSVDKPQEPKLNFSTDFTVTDNPGVATTVALSTGGSVLTAALKVNSHGVSADKQIFVDTATDGATAYWGVKINGTADGG